MKHDMFINPVTLHFYSPEELLPDNDDWKIVIVKTCNKKMDFRIATYSNKYDEWDEEKIRQLSYEIRKAEAEEAASS